MPELREMRRKAANEQVLSRRGRTPQLATSGTPEEHARHGGAVMALREAHATRTAEPKAILDQIRYDREQEQIESRPPTAWDVMRHKERVAEIGAPQPRTAGAEPPRYLRKDQLTTASNEIADLVKERELLFKEKPSKFWDWGNDRYDKWEKQVSGIDAQIADRQAELRGIAGMNGDDFEQILSLLPPDIKNRVTSLMQAGASPEEIIEALRAEGVI